MRKETYTEYGAFAVNTISGFEELIFRTEISERLCRDRAEEIIGRKNTFLEMSYDPGSLKILYRKVETKQYDWSETEPEAMAQEEAWYTEIWSTADLEDALNEAEVPCSEENIRKLRTATYDPDFRASFTDLSARNEKLLDLVYETITD